MNVTLWKELNDGQSENVFGGGAVGSHISETLTQIKDSGYKPKEVSYVVPTPRPLNFENFGDYASLVGQGVIG